MLTGLGDTEGALDELDLAIEDRSRFAVLLGVWPAFDPLRGNPRFPDLFRRLSLPGAS
ncbi:MAG: hypothetical protein AAGD06_25215 [Acidobacteriota bacterium]